MIWQYILSFISRMVQAVFDALNIPIVDQLPLGMDGYLSTAVQSFKAFAEIMPILGVVFNAFMFYLGFRVTLLTLRLLRVIR